MVLNAVSHRVMWRVRAAILDELNGNKSNCSGELLLKDVIRAEIDAEFSWQQSIRREYASMAMIALKRSMDRSK